jgi:type I restriction enzyme S subunit
MGQSPPSQYYNHKAKGTPFVQGKTEFGDLFIETKTWTTQCGKIAPSNSVIITVRAPVGELNLTRDEICIGRGVAAILNRGGDTTQNRYIYHMLRGLKDYLSLLGEAGTTYESTTREELEDFLVIYPRSSEQVRIATVLSWFDDLMANKKKQNKILENAGLAIFKNWFIDFQPFKNGEFVSGELGKIPKGWEIKPIGEVAKIRNGLSYNGKEKFGDPVDGSYIFITLNNVIEGGGFKPEFSWIRSRRIREDQFLFEGDLIIANTEQTKDERLVGSPAIVFLPCDYQNEKGVYSHHITKIAPTKQVFKLFLFLLLKLTREDTASFSTGTGVLGLDIKNIRNNKLVIVPPDNVLESFYSHVAPIFRKMILNQKEIMILNKIESVLLPLLILGKLRVDET